jgi:hypothetical protein
LSRLRWILKRQEELVAIVYDWGKSWGGAYVAFTSERMIFLKEGPFLKSGLVDSEIAWTTVTEIRRADKPVFLLGFELTVTGEQAAVISPGDTMTAQDTDKLLAALRQFLKAPGQLNQPVQE